MAPKINPCPICGSKVFVIREDYYPPSGGYQVICEKPGCDPCTEVWSKTREEAIELWNRRGENGNNNRT